MGFMEMVTNIVAVSFNTLLRQHKAAWSAHQAETTKTKETMRDVERQSERFESRRSYLEVRHLRELSACCRKIVEAGLVELALAGGSEIDTDFFAT